MWVSCMHIEGREREETVKVYICAHMSRAQVHSHEYTTTIIIL